jgi:DOMON domain
MFSRFPLKQFNYIAKATTTTAAATTTTKAQTPKDYTPKHDFNPMDCTDIVIGTARGEMSRIWDYYTRDRSTPRLDTFYGGKSELTSTGGFEKDGITTIIFRKKLSADEPTDHSITDDLMHVIWAKGQVSEPKI